MKERPILFSAPMVRAILNGTKTQTRRVAPISRVDIKQHDGGMVTWSVAFAKPVKGVLSSHSGGKFSVDQACRIVASQFCPYGQPGDRLWVRETWRHVEGGAVYDAAGGVMDAFDPETIYRADRPHAPGPWKPAIHMPRWASRITLEVTSVRVERLKDISEADAQAEGVNPDAACRQDDDAAGFHRIGPVRGDSFPIARYAVLWEKINGLSSWDANPWVWVVEFKRLEAA